jgi:hypothetical protein
MNEKRRLQEEAAAANQRALETEKENADLRERMLRQEADAARRDLVVAQMARKFHKMELDNEAARKRSEAMQQENIRLREQPEKPEIGCHSFDINLTSIVQLTVNAI